MGLLLYAQIGRNKDIFNDYIWGPIILQTIFVFDMFNCKEMTKDRIQRQQNRWCLLLIFTTTLMMGRGILAKPTHFWYRNFKLVKIWLDHSTLICHWGNQEAFDQKVKNLPKEKGIIPSFIWNDTFCFQDCNFLLQQRINFWQQNKIRGRRRRGWRSECWRCLSPEDLALLLLIIWNIGFRWVICSLHITLHNVGYQLPHVHWLPWTSAPKKGELMIIVIIITVTLKPTLASW